MTSTQNLPITLKLSVELGNEFHDLLIAVLAEIGYNAFEEHPHALHAYINQAQYNEAELDSVLTQYFPDQYPERMLEEMPVKDWNAEWEKNFQGITVDDFCEILPPFKSATGKTAHTVFIHPKMAFGTGHHATTRMVVRQLAKIDVKGKKVLDMGTGTGVLGILASQLGAAEIVGIDIDEWSYRNALENVEFNQVENMKILRGDANAIPGEFYDVIIANINRNVLEADAQTYEEHLTPDGTLILSGFFTIDEPELIARFAELGLVSLSRFEDHNWSSLSFVRETQTSR